MTNVTQPHRPGTVSARKHVLIVDDEPSGVLPLNLILEQEGYRVSIAYSGNEALQLLDAAVPDLVVLDLMMPGMTGAELGERLRARADTTRVPLFFVSSVAEVTLAQHFAGYDAFMRKPLRVGPFLERLAELL